nr:MAG TPA: hypothetical protein [Caudoviricetes sp.]
MREIIADSRMMHIGKTVKTGYHYTDGTTKYIALSDGVPSGFNDGAYFAEVAL